MDRNTIMAVVLSALVLIGYTIVQVKFFPKPQQSQATEQTAADAAQAEGEAEKAEAANAQVQSFVQAEDTNEPVITEQQYVIETKKARVTFTNKGGDIVGYELLDHKDNKTGRGVEMAENVTSSNRAFALNFPKNLKKQAGDKTKEETRQDADERIHEEHVEGAGGRR